MYSEKRIITILGDSLSMTRVEEGISIRNTYPFLLGDLLLDRFIILNKSKRGNTSLNQSQNQYLYDDIETTDSSFVIIQIGICDCSPRIISKPQRFILNNLIPNFLAKRFIQFKSRNRYFFTKYFPKTYVDINQFAKCIGIILNSSLKSKNLLKVIIINISDTSKINNDRSFGFKSNIIKYNDVLKNIAEKYSNVELIDFYSISNTHDDLLLNDGIHINYKAHEILANKLADVILKSIRENE